ncbi:rhomboid-domain-containing protein [Pluteus cervinus]|uniref:Rhomboid-domain-containing protein n=1 Tax=Pluteus cervinus TaxID=181527 RepID=A0ACD3BGG7_9AGAR|nr:rhomboid-domain-containing protein [Pluteus cervinus]
MTTTLLQRILLHTPRRQPNLQARNAFSLRAYTGSVSPILRLTRLNRPNARQFFTSSQFGQRHFVQPPRRNGFLDSIPEDTVFWSIIGLNGLVFGMWFMATSKYKQERDASAYKWMNENFTNSWRNLSSGRVWTLLSSAFSHENLGHIFFNGFTFFFMARPVLSMLGSKAFLALYLGGGIAANLAAMSWNNVIKGRDVPSHGASAAVYSVISFLACVAPTTTFQLYGIIPVPAWLVVAGIFSYDTYSALYDKRRGTDTAGHVAGLLAGAGYFLGKRFRLF